MRLAIGVTEVGPLNRGLGWFHHLARKFPLGSNLFRIPKEERRRDDVGNGVAENATSTEYIKVDTRKPQFCASGVSGAIEHEGSAHFANWLGNGFGSFDLRHVFFPSTGICGPFRPQACEPYALSGRWSSPSRSVLPFSGPHNEGEPWPTKNRSVARRLARLEDTMSACSSAR